MVDVLRLPFSNTVILDSSGDPVDGAQIEVFDAGTSNQKTVYDDAALTSAAANPIVANATGVMPVRYIGTGSWDATYENSSGDALSNYNTLDNVPGALDTSSFLTGTVSPSRGVISKTTNYTTVAGDLGKEINADATGGSFTITLLSAVTAADGGSFVIKHSGTDNEVTVAASGGQSIDGKTSFVLQAGDAVTVNADAADWHIQSAFDFTAGISTLTFDPSITPDFENPDGTNYQLTVTADTTINSPDNLRPGMWGSFTLIFDATGGHEVNWNSIFKGTVALDQSANSVNVISFHVRSSTAIDYWKETGRYSIVAVLEDQKTQNTDGGDATLGSWETRDLNTEVLDIIGVTISSNEFTLPGPGDYWITWQVPGFQVAEHQSRLYDVTGTAAVKVGTSARSASADNTQDYSVGGTQVSITADNTYRIEHQVIASNAGDGHGIAANIGTEVYTRVEIYAR